MLPPWLAQICAKVATARPAVPHIIAGTLQCCCLPALLWKWLSALQDPVGKADQLSELFFPNSLWMGEHRVASVHLKHCFIFSSRNHEDKVILFF